MGLFEPVRYAFVNLIYRLYGLDVFGKYRWLKSTFSWSPAQRQEWRLQRLGDILEFAWRNVPFYREYWGDHGVEFFRPKDVDELQRYPILTKDVFRENAKRIRPVNLSSIRYREWHTGGTTGQPVHYLRDLEHWTLCEAFHLWGWSQFGYRFGDPVGVIAGGSLIPERRSLEARVRAWMHRRLFLYGVTMDRALAKKYYRMLVKHGAKFLYGYPSVMFLFGKFLAEEGLSLPKLKAVVTTGEMLLPHYRQTIEKTLGCPVFDNLGCNDGGFESYECQEHNGFHYNDLQAILEVEDCLTGGESRLIITNLWNKSTPFIRYENGDFVTLSKDPCACGSPFPKISTIRGRTADILIFRNGRFLSGPALTLIFGEMEIDGWQIVQTGPNRLEVRILCREGLNPKYVAHIRRILSYHLSDDIEVDIKRVEKLELTRAGKWKPIWREVEEKLI